MIAILSTLLFGSRVDAQMAGGAGAGLGGVAGNAMFAGRGMANSNFYGGGLGDYGQTGGGMAVGSVLRGTSYVNGGGMAIGNVLRGNPSGMSPGAQVAGGGGTIAPSPNMIMGALGAGAGATMQQGMPGAVMGPNNVGPNRNNMAFQRGMNQSRTAQGGGGRLGGGAFQRYGRPSGRFSTWGGGGTPGGFGFGNRQNIGGFGFGYTGSPMFGRTSRQQNYYNAYGGGGAY